MRIMLMFTHNSCTLLYPSFINQNFHLNSYEQSIQLNLKHSDGIEITIC